MNRNFIELRISVKCSKPEKIEEAILRSCSSSISYHLISSEIVVEGESTDKYPLQKKRHTFEFLRTI